MQSVKHQRKRQCKGVYISTGVSNIKEIYIALGNTCQFIALVVFSLKYWYAFPLSPPPVTVICPCMPASLKVGVIKSGSWKQKLHLCIKHNANVHYHVMGVTQMNLFIIISFSTRKDPSHWSGAKS